MHEHIGTYFLSYMQQVKHYYKITVSDITVGVTT